MFTSCFSLLFSLYPSITAYLNLSLCPSPCFTHTMHSCRHVKVNKFLFCYTHIWKDNVLLSLIISDICINRNIPVCVCSCWVSDSLWYKYWQKQTCAIWFSDWWLMFVANVSELNFLTYTCISSRYYYEYKRYRDIYYQQTFGCSHINIQKN